MAYVMSELEILSKERRNSGSTWTRNPQFEKDGYLIVKNLWNPEELYHPVPKERGKIRYLTGKIDEFEHTSDEQVEGSLARWGHPHYLRTHNAIRKKVEKEIGRKLYNTYFYDRFYFAGNQLRNHIDRDACEISVSIHISTNLPEPEKHWPIKIKTPDTYTDDKKTAVLVPGMERSVVLQSGDGLIYKGSERPHWRDPMPTPKKKWFSKDETEYYYHQIFFHYVLQDGERAHYAWDRGG